MPRATFTHDRALPSRHRAVTNRSPAGHVWSHQALGQNTQVTSRIAWIDLVKATSVVLVVLMHSGDLLARMVGSTETVQFWWRVNDTLEPLRMPIFFVVSGMMAASAVTRNWRLNTIRTTGMVYLYLLWSGILFATLYLTGARDFDVVQKLAQASSGYWYLYALVLFFLIARALRRVPPLIVLSAAALPALFREQTSVFFAEHAPDSLFAAMAMNLVFFLAGVYHKDLVAWISRETPHLVLVVIGTAAAGLSLHRSLNPETWHGVTLLPVSGLWILFGVGLAHWLTDGRTVPGADYVGRRTLPIFVLQFPIIHFAGMYLPAPTNPILQILFPLAVTATITALALWLHAAVESTPARHLFTAPTAVLEPPRLWASEPATTQLEPSTSR